MQILSKIHPMCSSTERPPMWSVATSPEQSQEGETWVCCVYIREKYVSIMFRNTGVFPFLHIKWLIFPFSSFFFLCSYAVYHQVNLFPTPCPILNQELCGCTGYLLSVPCNEVIKSATSQRLSMWRAFPSMRLQANGELAFPSSCLFQVD